jgi:hypothetical protein
MVGLSMRKTYKFVLGSIIFSTTYFGLSYCANMSINKNTESYLASHDLMLPNQGVVIKSINKFVLPSEYVETFLKEQKEMKEKGYVSGKDDNFDSLKGIAVEAKKELKNNSESTDLRKRLMDIKLAYITKYKDSDFFKTIGFAPVGIELDSGWSGFVSYFVPTSFKACSFVEQNYKLENGSVEVAQEAVSHLVNNKISDLYVKGNNRGYVYSVDWYSDEFGYNLQCIHDNYSRKIVDLFIELAKNLDSVNDR